MIIHDKIEQGSQAWLELRLGKVTGSRIEKVFKASNLELIDELIAESETGMSKDSGYVSESMQRGLDLEPVAVAEYERIKNVKGVNVGFIQSSEQPLLGMSPDRLFITPNPDREIKTPLGPFTQKGEKVITGSLEVKCPDSKTHIQYLRMGLVPVDYRWQVYSPFLISDKIEWVDFMSFDPRVTKKPRFIIRTYRADIEEELTAATDSLNKFFDKLKVYHEKIMF